jgi:hypothetical protein
MSRGARPCEAATVHDASPRLQYPPVPRTWRQAGVARAPTRAAPPGAVLDWTRLIVRGYDTTASGSAGVPFQNARYELDTSVMNEPDMAQRRAVVGDTVLWVGIARGHDEPVVWPPALLVAVGAANGSWRTAHTLVDGLVWPEEALDPSRDGVIKRSACGAGLWALIDELSELGGYASSSQAALIASAFGLARGLITRGESW